MEHVLNPQPGYPFSLGLSIEYALTDSGLRVRTTGLPAADLHALYAPKRNRSV
jgi:aldose 1-epimerase